jgi:glycosyltransferase involved in cell wall biosynthesis
MGGGPRNPGERKWWLWGLDREMRRRGVDLFHGTDYSVPYLAHRPSVMTLHDLSPWLDPAWQPAASRVRRRTPRLLRMGLATMVITPSEAVRRGAIERFGLQPDRVVAVPLAAADELFTPPPAAAKPRGNPYFLFVGTLEPRKNVARLVDAWREVRKTIAVDLVLAGRTRADFPPLAPEPGLRLLGEVPDADLPGLYSGALACVYPSLYEGFGLPVVEAMQCGALVITSRDPAVLEASGDGAVHVDATDTAALAEAMRAVSANPAGFQEVRQRGLARAAQFSWRNTARRTREVYDAATRAFSHS